MLAPNINFRKISMVPGWLHGAKKAALGHVRPSNFPLSFFLSIVFNMYLYMYMYSNTHELPKMSPRNSILSYIVREGRAGGRVMRSNPASKAAHQPIVSDNHTQTHTHPHPQTTNLAQNSSPKWIQKVPKTGRQICPKHCILLRKIDFHRREKSCSGPPAP